MITMPKPKLSVKVQVYRRRREKPLVKKEGKEHIEKPSKKN